MKKTLKIIIFLVVLVSVCVPIMGCKSTLPNEEKIKQDLMENMSDIESKDDIKELTINAVQDNKKEDKTAIYRCTAVVDNSNRKSIMNFDFKMNYEYYDEGGWKAANFEIDESSMKEKPNFEISDDEIEDKISKQLEKSNIIKWAQDDDSRPKIGEIEKQQEYDQLKAYNVKDIKIISNSYEDGQFGAEINVVGEYIDYVGKYKGVIQYNLPNWSIESLTPINQDATYKIPNEIKEKQLSYVGRHACFQGGGLDTYDVKCNIIMKKDSDGKITGADIKIRDDYPLTKSETDYTTTAEYTDNKTIILNPVDGSTGKYLYKIEVFACGADQFKMIFVKDKELYAEIVMGDE